MSANSYSPAEQQILSEIGFSSLPNHWGIVRIEELLSKDRGISVGVMYPGDHDPDGVPLIKAGDLAGNIINSRPEFRISRDKHLEYQRTEFVGGEVLLSLVGDIGRCAVVPPSMKGWNSARATALIRLNDPLDAPYFRLCMLSKQIQHLMNVWATTTVQATLNLKEIRQIPLPWPPKSERHRIAEILGALDDKIELNRRMNETLEAMARALFKSWFVDFDPVHAKAAVRKQHPTWTNAQISRVVLPKMSAEVAELFPDSFQDSTLGPIPKGWSTRPLYDIAHFINGAAFQSSDFCAPAIGKPIIKIAELKSVITAQTKYSQKDIGPDREIQCGDTLYSWSGSPDTSLATFRWTGRDGLLNQHIFKVVTENRADEIFAYYQLNDLRDTLVEIARNKQTTGLGHVTVADMKRLQIIRSAPEILQAFADNTGPIYDQSFNLSVDSLTLERTRDMILPRLLSGDLSVTSEVV